MSVHARSGTDTLVTIMVPTYGQARYLSRAIASVLDQDYEHLEVLIADDASPDDTGAVAASFAYDPRVRYVRNERNLGRVENYRHSLHNLSRGEYVLNLDGDDWLTDPTYIRRAAGLLDAELGVDMVFANAWSFLESSGEYLLAARHNIGLDRVNNGNALFLRYADATVWIPHLTALYRRRVAIELGFYGLDAIGSDTDSLLRILLGRQIGFIDSTVAAWRVHGVNASKSLDLKERFDNLACIDDPYEAAVALAQIDIGSLRQWRRKMLTRLCSDFLRSAVRSGAYLTAARFYGALMLARPVIGARVATDSLARALELLTSRKESVTPSSLESEQK